MASNVLPFRRPDDDIPAHVRAEMETAERLWHELRGERREVRFDKSEGRVVATLWDLDAKRGQVVPLRAAVELDGAGPDAA